jgi:hypothetical protein
MARYELGLSIAATAGAGNVFDIGGGTGRVELIELGIAHNTAVVFDLALFRTTAVGTRTSPILFNAADPALGAATTGIATAWSGAPTLATNALRRWQNSANVGAGLIWTWGEDNLVIAAAGSLVVTCAAATPALRVYAVIEE